MKRMLVFGGLLAALVVGAPEPASAQAVTVVVNAANPVTALTRDQVTKFFMKKAGKWESGNAVTPVDQSDDAPARAAFTKSVMGKSPAAVKMYWQQMIFSGQEQPPAQKDSDGDVIAFVRSNPNAIGYVAAGTSLGAGVKAVAVQ